MNFIIAGFAMQVWLLLFIVWGVKHFEPKEHKLRGGHIHGPYSDDSDFIHAYLDTTHYLPVTVSGE